MNEIILFFAKFPLLIHELLLVDHEKIRFFRLSILYASFAFIISLVREVVKDMEDTLLSTDNGIGLAAPQVGVHLRIVLITLYRGAKDDEGKILVLINPEITKYSADTVIMEEGCLSIPGFYEKVERPAKIEVTFMDMKGKMQTLALDGINAREVLHEIDHLDGVLFTDYLEGDKVVRMPDESARPIKM